MKKLIIYAVVLAAALLVQTNRSDVGKLQPVELVSVCRENGEIVIRTDTGDMGRGVSVDDAIRNLKETTAGIVYLDTADYLVVKKDSQHLIPEMANYLKKKAYICTTGGGILPEDAAKYLAAHPPGVQIGNWETGTQLEELTLLGDRMILK